MVSNFNKFNEEISLMESSFITELKENISMNNYDENIIDYPNTIYAKVYWSFTIDESESEITNINPDIKKIEFKTNHIYYKQPINDNYDTYKKVEIFTLYKEDIIYERFDEEKISLPFKPRSIDFDMKTKKAEVGFFNYQN